jgi:hypothetical protein
LWNILIKMKNKNFLSHSIRVLNIFGKKIQ